MIIFNYGGESLMNILIIGGTRFIGVHLVENLLSNHHKVTIATRGQAADKFGNRVNRIIFERTIESSIKEKLSSLSFDMIFDSLAYCSNDVRILLNNVSCERYIFISSTAVYRKHMNIKEEEFNPYVGALIWCNRQDYPYDETKRQAERASVQAFPQKNIVAARFPFVIGNDDYTNRLYFYVEHIMKQKPMFIDNYEEQLAFIRADEAGEFLAFLAQNKFTGAINGASVGTISIRQIADYVYDQTGKVLIVNNSGDEAPYNGENKHSINTDKANHLGYHFSSLNNWIFDLLDTYIDKANCLL